MDALIDVDVARASTDELVHPELGTNTPRSFRASTIPSSARPSRRPPTSCENRRHAPLRACRWSAAASSPTGIPHDQELTVWSSTQSAHGVRGFLAGLLGIGTNQVRVLQPTSAADSARRS